MLCLRCQPSPHWPCQCCIWNIWLLSLNLASHGGSWVIQVSRSFPPWKLPIEAACHLFRALLPKGRRPHAALRERKLSTLQMWSCCSYPTSFSNTVAWIPGFCDNLGSHMLCFCSFWSLCPRSFISVTPSHFLYPMGLNLSVSSVWNLPKSQSHSWAS